MAICFFTAKHSDGSGDVVQTVKIADFVQKLAQSHTYTDDVVIVVPEMEKDTSSDPEAPPPVDHKAIAMHFTHEITPKIKVYTISEFKKLIPKVDCCIQAGYLHPTSFDWQKEIEGSPPFIFMPEYSQSVTFHPEGSLEILGGFFHEKEVGIIPSQELLDATTEEEVPQSILQRAFEQLAPKIRTYFGKDFEAYKQYRASRGFTYQYSHDRTDYQFNDEDGHGVAKPSQLFFTEHAMFLGDTPKSQDVLCIGEEKKRKRQALRGALKVLIKKGYTKIAFVDLDDGTEDVLHSNPSASPVKEYRVLYAKSLPFSTMKTLPLFTGDLIGATGDHSLVEAMSAGKLISYECPAHKASFVSGYLYAVRKATQNEDVRLLARLLMKRVGRGGFAIEYSRSQIQKLLSNKEVVRELRKINRDLVAKSKYFKHVEDMLISHLFKQRISFLPPSSKEAEEQRQKEEDRLKEAEEQHRREKERLKAVETEKHQKNETYPVRADTPRTISQAEKEFNEKLALLHAKIENLAQRRDAAHTEEKQPFNDAYLAAHHLHASLKRRGELFFKTPNLSTYTAFLKDCHQDIEQARPILETHRGYKKIADILLYVLLIGFFLAAINWCITGRFSHGLFKTESAQIMGAIEEKIEHLAVAA